MFVAYFKPRVQAELWQSPRRASARDLRDLARLATANEREMEHVLWARP
jgi:hypothetical protein